MLDKNKIIEVLKTCYDPEIPIDLWNLGLIYDIILTEVNNKIVVEVTMTLTTPGCGMANQIADDAKNKILKLNDVSDVKMTITFNPIWSPEMMTEEGKIKLGFKKKEDNNWE